jgi:predicted nucleic acid-binding protein
VEWSASVTDHLRYLCAGGVSDDALLRRGLALATQFNRPTAYDAQYLAVAERLGCDFWTADERLYNAVNTQLAWVHWLGGAATP